ncbi:hypothetical protein [Actinoplanes sp. NPDC049118]
MSKPPPAPAISTLRADASAANSGGVSRENDSDSAGISAGFGTAP